VNYKNVQCCTGIFQPIHTIHVYHILPKGLGCVFTPNGLAVVVVLNEKPEPPVVVAMVPNPDFPNSPPPC
jgi:hypothetical protein